MKLKLILVFVFVFCVVAEYVQFAGATYWMIPCSNGWTSSRDVTDGSKIIRVERTKDWLTGNVLIDVYDITDGTGNPDKISQFEISDDDLYQYDKMSQGRGLDLAVEMTAYTALLGLGLALTEGYVAVGGEAGLAAEDALTKTLLGKAPSTTREALRSLYRKIDSEYAKKSWLTGDLNRDNIVEIDEVNDYIERVKYGLVSPDKAIEAIYNLNDPFSLNDLISRTISGLDASVTSQMASDWLNRADDFFISRKYGEAARACGIVGYLDPSLGESCAYMQKTSSTATTGPSLESITETTSSPSTGTTTTSTTTAIGYSCPPGQYNCVISGGCIPNENKCCVGYSCPPGQKCCLFYGCIPDENECCVGYSCPPGQKCCLTYGCIPDENECCGFGGSCPPGQSCSSFPIGCIPER